MARTDILLFAEDPSAANYAALLLPELAHRGWDVQLYAAAVARQWLHDHGIAHVPVSQDTDARSLISRLSPRVVLTGTAENPETLGLALIDAARIAGIPAVSFVDALMSAPYRFCGTSNEPLAHAPDWLLVPDTMTRDAFLGLGFPAERISICGHPQYDLTRALAMKWDSEGGPQAFRRRIFPSVDPEKRILTFISEGALRYNLLPKRKLSDFGFGGRGMDKGRTKIVLEEVLDALGQMPEKTHVVFRAHPIESPDDYAEYRHEIQQFSSGGSALELVYASDLIVGMTSMLLLEAALLGRPTLAVLAQESEVVLLPSVRSGLTRHVTDRESLRSALPGMLYSSGGVMPQHRNAAVVEGAAERVVQVMASLI